MSKVIEELDFIKTIIVEQHSSVQKLQKAEERAEMEKANAPWVDPPLEVPPAYNNPQWPRPRAIPQALPSLESAISDSSDDEDAIEGNEGVEVISSVPPSDNERVGFADDKENAVKAQPRPSRRASPAPNLIIARPSSLLLQMVPYHSNAIVLGGRSFLPSDGLGKADETNVADGLSSATKSACLLLDKWTVSGSATIADLIGEKLAKDEQEK